jgi:hypothetical protein
MPEGAMQLEIFRIGAQAGDRLTQQRLQRRWSRAVLGDIGHQPRTLQGVRAQIGLVGVVA